MKFKMTYFLALLASAWVMTSAGTAQALSNVVFMSGDQGSYNTAGSSCSGAQPECVAINTTTSFQGTIPANSGGTGNPALTPSKPPGEVGATGSGLDRDVLVLNGSGGVGSNTFANTFWYQPNAVNNTVIGGGDSLNSFLSTQAGSSQTAAWVSYTESGTTGTTANISPNPPAVPNYCGTSGGGSPGSPSIGGNNNPTGTPACNATDPKGNQARAPQPANPSPANDTGRVVPNQTAKFSQTVNVPAGLYDLTMFVWTDDTAVVEALICNDALCSTTTHIAMTPSNPFPAPTTTQNICIGSPVSCGTNEGQKFTASGLGAGTYIFNFYAFQVGSDVFGTLWGGAFTQTQIVPEPGTVVLLGLGLAGLGLVRRRKTM